MDRPKVSVIIPTYNRAALLGDAVESVLAQTFRDLELLIVDDGSVDGTEALVRGYCEKDSRVRYLRQENRGSSAAINTASRAARGQYIARLDSDDVWLPDLLEIEVPILDARPEIACVYSKGQWMRADRTLLPRTLGYAPHFPGETLRSMLWDDCTCVVTTVARRECYEKAPHDETLRTSVDWDMWLRVAVDREFAYVDRILAHVRAHDGNITGPKGPTFAGFLDLRRKVLDKFFSRSDLKPEIAAMKPVAYRNLYVYIGDLWMKTGHFRRAARAFGMAMRAGCNPAATLGMILWFGLANGIIGRTKSGRDFLRWQSEWRLKRRARRARS